MTKLCEGRVAVVTGAGIGLGRSHAMMLARHGAKVIVNDIGVDLDGKPEDGTVADRVVAEIRALGGEAVANKDDITSWDGARNLIGQAIETYGSLDVVINNAGILRDCYVWEMTESEWDDVIRVHLKGTFLPTRHATEYWKRKFDASGQPVNGRIINMTSTSGIYGNLQQVHYGGAKGGIASFTIIAARELREIGVTVNAIAPGAQTRMTEGRQVWTAAQLESRDPRWTSALVTWISSLESADVTARVFQTGNGILAVCEGWRRGAQADPIDDPASLGPAVADLIKHARRNVGMDGLELD